MTLGKEEDRTNWNVENEKIVHNEIPALQSFPHEVSMSGKV